MEPTVLIGIVTAVVVNLFTLLTVIATGLLTARKTHETRKADLERAERQRRWEIEDRRAIAEKVVADQHFAAATVTAIARELAEKVALDQAQTRTLADAVAKQMQAENVRAAESRAKLQSSIEDNTSKTEGAARQAERAYTEANHVNNKIAALGLIHQTLAATTLAHGGTPAEPAPTPLTAAVETVATKNEPEPDPEPAPTV